VTLHILFAAKRFYGNPDLVRLTFELAQRGHRITAATCLKASDRDRQEEGVTIFETRPIVTVHSLAYPFSIPFSELYRIIQQQGVDVVHAVDDYSTNTAMAASVSKAANVPFVYTIQGMGQRTGHLLVDPIVALYDWTIERMIARSARRVILQSKSLASRADWLGVRKSNIVVIPSGVDLARFDPAQPEAKRNAALLSDELDVGDNLVVGYVGRLIAAKGLAYLIAAVSEVQKAYPNVVLLIVGDGPYRKDLETMAKELKVRAIFAGWQADTPPFYALMDIFVLPSFFEGLPNVMLEAMAMRKALVATAIGANVDLVVDGKNGFLVPIRDDRRIAFALEKLIDDSDMRARMGRINRQIVKENFTWDVVVPRFEKLYDTITNDG